MTDREFSNRTIFWIFKKCFMQVVPKQADLRQAVLRQAVLRQTIFWKIVGHCVCKCFREAVFRQAVSEQEHFFTIMYE